MKNLLNNLHRYFSEINTLYDYQEKVLEKLLKHQNTLAIIPTGGGKSLLYQLMATDLKGITLVISPLLALMQEQVTELNNRGISTLALNSSFTFDEQRTILRTMKPGDHKLIYVSAERLQNSFFRAALIASGIQVSMIAIDEAHCISQWGVGFRPDYSQINEFAGFLKDNGHTPFLFCLTATLSRRARQDIAIEFGIADDNIIVYETI